MGKRCDKFVAPIGKLIHWIKLVPNFIEFDLPWTPKLFATTPSTLDSYFQELDFIPWTRCCPKKTLKIPSTCFAFWQVIKLFCSFVPWSSSICVSNLKFEHSKLESLFLFQCWQAQVASSILDKFALNLLWSFPIICWTTPFWCSHEPSSHAYFGVFQVMMSIPVELVEFIIFNL